MGGTAFVTPFVRLHLASSNQRLSGFLCRPHSLDIEQDYALNFISTTGFVNEDGQKINLLAKMSVWEHGHITPSTFVQFCTVLTCDILKETVTVYINNGHTSLALTICNVAPPANQKWMPGGPKSKMADGVWRSNPGFLDTPINF